VRVFPKVLRLRMRLGVDYAPPNWEKALGKGKFPFWEVWKGVRLKLSGFGGGIKG